MAKKCPDCGKEMEWHSEGKQQADGALVHRFVGQYSVEVGYWMCPGDGKKVYDKLG